MWVTSIRVRERVPEEVCMWLCARACDCVRERCVPECYAHVCTWALGLWLFFQDASGTSPASGLERKGVCSLWEERPCGTPALLLPPHPQVPSLVPTHPLSWGLCIQTGALHPHSLASARAPCWLPQAPCPDFFEFPPIFLNHL